MIVSDDLAASIFRATSQATGIRYEYTASVRKRVHENMWRKKDKVRLNGQFRASAQRGTL